MGSNGSVLPAEILEETQAFKVPQLRNVYARTGRIPSGGKRTSGFGIFHDGSFDRPSVDDAAADADPRADDSLVRPARGSNCGGAAV